jgi:hypothetical protein
MRVVVMMLSQIHMVCTVGSQELPSKEGESLESW